MIATRFSSIAHTGTKPLLCALVRAHAGKMVAAGLVLGLLGLGQFSPVGDFLSGAEDTWRGATARALPHAKAAREPIAATGEICVRQIWEQVRKMVDLAFQLTADTPNLIPDAATFERYRTAETVSDLYPVSGTTEKLRQRIVSGEVDEKGLLDLMAPERTGGGRPAPPAHPR